MKMKSIFNIKATKFFSASIGLFAISILYTNCSGFSAISPMINSVAQNSSGVTPSLPAPLRIQVGVIATPAQNFLNSLGVNTHNAQGYNASNYVTPLQYLGVRAIRDAQPNLSNLIMLHQQTGILVDLCGYGDLTGLISAARTLDAAGAFLSFEGPNEPNNFQITYNGKVGGGFGAGTSWVAVAQFQTDLYNTVKSDATLSKYPVFSPSEVGAESDNVGLQFLTIPVGAHILFPDGTKFADFVNPHNYVSSTQNIYKDNQAWQSADPALNSSWDGIYGSNVITWAQKFAGYTLAQLPNLPRVTTETGWDSVAGIGGEIVQGVVLSNTYLAQFKQNYKYTFIYELVDGEGSSGNQGLFHSDYTPKLAATYIHNMTTILADTGSVTQLEKVNYSISNQPSTVHDLLLQKSNGHFELVIWDERTTATDTVTVDLGQNYDTINVYDITLGTAPTKILNNVRSVSLTLTNHALILEL